MVIQTIMMTLSCWAGSTLLAYQAPADDMVPVQSEPVVTATDVESIQSEDLNVLPEPRKLRPIPALVKDPNFATATFTFSDDEGSVQTVTGVGLIKEEEQAAEEPQQFLISSKISQRVGNVKNVVSSPTVITHAGKAAVIEMKTQRPFVTGTEPGTKRFRELT